MLTVHAPWRALAAVSVAAVAVTSAALTANAVASSRPDACPAATVTVHTSSELKSALAGATPGDVIVLADGVYNGTFVADRPATSAAPITVCGSRGAILNAGGPSGGYVLHLDGADYWRVLGITVRHGQKGIMLDGTSHALISGVEVYDTGDEAVHLRRFSTHNVVENSVIHDTGHRNTKFGEGVYVGSAQSNWSGISGGKPDESDYNVIRNNTIYDTTAESVDIKEGTEYGVLSGNTFDGSLLVTSGADSWVDVKGRNWVIEGNTGRHSPMDGFQTHKIVNGWGTGNVFRDNVADVEGPGFGFSLTPVLENVVECSNTVTDAPEGYANVDCVGDAPAPVVTDPTDEAAPTEAPAPTEEPTPEPSITPAPEPTDPPAPEPTDPPATRPAPVAGCPVATVQVATAAALQDALDDASAGDVIQLAPGTYRGEFDTRGTGSAARPIWLCGDGATLVGDGIRGGEVLSLNRASYWNVVGLTLTEGQTGLEVKASDHVTISRVRVAHIGDEGVVVKYGSSQVAIGDSAVAGTGARKASKGWALVVTDSSGVVVTGLTASDTPAGVAKIDASASDTVVS